MLGGAGLFVDDRRLQPVEGFGEQADLVAADDRQGLARNLTVIHAAEQCRGFGQGAQLQAQPPPADQGGDQGQDRGEHDQVAFHGLDRGEGFIDRQDGLHHPAGGGNALVGRQFDHATRAFGDSRTFVAFQVAVIHRIDTGRRAGLHDSPLVGRGNEDASLGCGDQEVPGIAIFGRANFVQEVGFGQVGHADDQADGFTLGIVDGNDHGEHREPAVGADDRLGKLRLAGVQGRGDEFIVAVMAAGALQVGRCTGDGRAGMVGNDDAPVEDALGNLAPVDQGLCRGGRGEGIGGQAAGQRFGNVQAFKNGAVDFLGNQRNRGELLGRDRRLHVAAQGSAERIFRRPQDTQHDNQHAGGNSGL